MPTPRLRIFPRPQDEPEADQDSPAIPIRLADLYPLLAQAYRDNFVWLRDFEEDELLVSTEAHAPDRISTESLLSNASSVPGCCPSASHETVVVFRGARLS